MKTLMIIDNKAKAERNGCKPFEYYEIDRDIFETEKDLRSLAKDCMNSNVYSITVLENNRELFRMQNTI